MKNLIDQLTNQTQDLKTAYVARTEEWASEEFERLLAFKNAYQEEKDSKKRMMMEKKYWSLPHTVFAHQPNKVKFVQDEVVKAEQHYEASIAKLAFRIQTKGLNEDTLQMETSYLDPNICTTITDGQQTVRAFTIIASGEIQRPHYRYLVK